MQRICKQGGILHNSRHVRDKSTKTIKETTKTSIKQYRLGLTGSDPQQKQRGSQMPVTKYQYATSPKSKNAPSAFGHQQKFNQTQKQKARTNKQAMTNGSNKVAAKLALNGR